MRFARLIGFVLAAALVVLTTACAPGVVAGEQVKAASEEGVTVIAVGDIGDCETQKAQLTADLVQRYPAAPILSLGDNIYGDGSREEFEQCFDPFWGQFKERIRPVPGNHEYKSPQAQPYFDYFGPSAGSPEQSYYSFDLNGWHIVALDSNCDQVDCSPSSDQIRWLYQDLRLSRAQCTLMYWHHPYWSSDGQDGSGSAAAFWKLANRFRADVVVNGHDHYYERYTPIDNQGKYNLQGIRLFIAGTGGASLHALPEIRPNNIERDNNTHGILKFTLFPDRYDWEFIPVDGGQFRDSGSGECH